ncbi:MAG: bifunctional phosphoribosyl-AMP cyclohydrolase/phosphoribosyl-ATP diphosphatase HisIE [Gammaproteobacteria bacterium]|nr:bifunctional phosphoribosyl-AMP cyclohydrolase/phosphoribosyl-ATP diphosphatase HisIE [Gammaproteobacteria bacterium]
MRPDAETEATLASLDFAKGDGLLPAVVQHAQDGRVLMVGWMNAEAARETLRRGRVVFWSRSRSRLWEKGETTGHGLLVRSIAADCDRDTLLVQALPQGPTCHTGSATCFGDGDAPGAFLAQLESLIAARLQEAPEGSYTARLAAQGVKRVAQKVGEEGVETALAATAGGRDELVGESADLLYHLLVLLRLRGVPLLEVERELGRRHAARQSAISGAGDRKL